MLRKMFFAGAIFLFSIANAGVPESGNEVRESVLRLKLVLEEVQRILEDSEIVAKLEGSE